MGNTGQLQNVGAPNVPGGTLEQVNFYRWVRNTLVGLQAAMIPPDTPSNVRATAVAGGIQVDFTRSDGDNYILYRNTTPSVNGATRIELGTANVYTDDFGAGSVLRYYTVLAKKGNVIAAPSPWVSATSLALGTPITPPTPPPPTYFAFTDDETEGEAQATIASQGDYVGI